MVEVIDQELGKTLDSQPRESSWLPLWVLQHQLAAPELLHMHGRGLAVQTACEPTRYEQFH